MSDQQDFTIGTRIRIRGTSGSGKSTLAKELAQITGYTRIEIDAIHWLPEWQERDLEETKQLLEQATQGDQWILEGNYRKQTAHIAHRADTTIWLDYPFLLVLRQIVSRTLRRTLKKEVLWNGNKESFTKGFFSKDSIILWAITTHTKNRRQADEYFANVPSGVKALRLRHPREAQTILDLLSTNEKSAQDLR